MIYLSQKLNIEKFLMSRKINNSKIKKFNRTGDEEYKIL